MIRFLDSVCVGQFAKKNRSESFVRSFIHISGSGESRMDSSQPSRSDEDIFMNEVILD